MWKSPGFSKLTSNYSDLLFDVEANAAWCDFLADKIRGIVTDPATADKLIPSDHRFGEKRPPFVTAYFETFNQPHVELVDLRATPMVRVTPRGIETTDMLREFDIIVWATGFDFGTGALSRMGIRGRGGLALDDHWADGPRTFLGIQTTKFPNFFFPGGPHAAAGNNPRYNGDQVGIHHRVARPPACSGLHRHRGATQPPRRSGPPWWTAGPPEPRPSGRAATTSEPTFPESPGNISSTRRDGRSSWPRSPRSSETDYEAFTRTLDGGHRRQRGAHDHREGAAAAR